MATDQELSSYAIKSYRYLRLAIVVVVVALGASVILERAHARCWEGSISAYYYTPVHAMFVGALVTIGVCLLAVHGSTVWEDVLLNVSGLLAPVVAFVPTSPPPPDPAPPAAPLQRCSTHALGTFSNRIFIGNNIVAFAIGGAAALTIAVLVATRKHQSIAPKHAQAWFGLGLSAAIGIAELIWYAGWRSSFLAHAHSWSAIAMFAVVGVVIGVDAHDAKGAHRIIYTVLVAFMAAAFVIVLILKQVYSDWRHQVLYLEVLELAPFVVFWAIQTFEHWEFGVRPRSG